MKVLVDDRGTLHKTGEGGGLLDSEGFVGVCVCV